MLDIHGSKHTPWIALNNREIEKYRINVETTEVIKEDARVYFNIGSAPQIFPRTRIPGTRTNGDNFDNDSLFEEDGVISELIGYLYSTSLFLQE